MVSILRQRNFGLLWFGQVISMAGDWVLYASLAFYVYTLTGSVLLSGSMMIVSTLPRIVLGSIAGVFVDRWDRRRTMIVADLGRAVVLLSLLAVHSAGDMWIVYLAALGDAALAQFFGPAKNALVPRIVTTEELVRANSANSVGEQIGRLAGPAVGGFMLARLGLHSVVIFDVLSFVVSAALIALMALPPPSTRAAPPSAADARVRRDSRRWARRRTQSRAGGGAQPWLKVWRELLAGLRLIRANQVVAALFLLWTITSIGEGLLDVLVVPWVSSVLEGTSLTFGWMMTVQAIGSIAGGAILASAGKTRQAPLARGARRTRLGRDRPRDLQRAPRYPWRWSCLCSSASRSRRWWSASTPSSNPRCPTSTGDGCSARWAPRPAIAMLAGMAISSALADRVGIVTMLNVACVVIIIGAVVTLGARWLPDRRAGRRRQREGGDFKERI